MKFKVTPIKLKHIMPGDMFSQYDQLVWDTFQGKGAVGQMVYIRTNEPINPDEKDEIMYLVEIEKGTTSE
jgi:hypothetical protein